MANPLLDIGNDNLIDISRKLEESHLVYLQTDESPLKLQQRKKLEGYIKEFLCLVRHEHKYVFRETADILHRSAETMKDFSGYRACTAWSAISLYAANLLAQPWRKEYRTLRTFSGYYKHEVETNLIGAELMFELMGYKHVDLGVMHLEAPIDPDKVSSVSRDSIVAFVECQILKQIWEAVSKNRVSWLEVLHFRENYVCSPEQAIRALNQRYLDKLNHDHHGLSHGVRDSLHGLAYCHAQPVMINSNVAYDYNYVPYSDYRYLENAACGTEAVSLYHLNSNYDARYGYPYMPHSPKCAQNVQISPIASQCRVPTGRLIELDQDKFNGKLDYDEVDRYNYMPEKRSPKQDNENWDYVFQNLASQGHKNLNDELHYRHKISDTKLKKEKYTEEKHNLNPIVDNLKASHHGHKMAENVFHEFNMEDELSSDQERKMNANLRNASPGVTEIMETMKYVQLDKNGKSDDEDNKNWNCASCTYLNKPKNEICEMCNKSRHKGNEDVPLASGSKECPKCTLINEKDAKQCAACYNSLKDSPTYI